MREDELLMKTIAFVIPWIGKLPDYFQLWLESCKWNTTIDFFVFTNDRTNYNYPKNVKIHYMDWEDMKVLFQKPYDFPIMLNKPYKFCDFKPAFGEIFSEYLNGYDFWGHCDIDLIWGDIRKFITEDILNKYDRIYTCGHCSLYRNTPEVNSWYRTLPSKGYQCWKEVFQKDKSFCFDEWAGHCGGGLSQIIKANNIEMFDDADFADINMSKGYFCINRKPSEKKNNYFKYKNGKLFVICGDDGYEVLYCHFQKRKLTIELDVIRNIERQGLPTINGMEYYIIAPGIVTTNTDLIKRYKIREIMFEIKYYLRKFRRKLRVLSNIIG